MTRDRQAFTLIEAVMVVMISALVFVSLSESYLTAIRSYSSASRGQDLMLSANWALQRMLEDVRRSIEVRATGPDILVLTTQLVENAHENYETITWRRNADESVTRQSNTSAPVLYTGGCTSLVTNGPRLWTTMEGNPSVITPMLGPPGSVTGFIGYVLGPQGFGSYLQGAGESITYPATILNPDQGTVEMWVDLTNIGGATSTERVILDTSVSGSGQRLTWSIFTVSGRHVVAWRGTPLITWTPTKLEKRWTHMAISWDTTRRSLAGVSISLQLYGKRVASWTGDLNGTPFDGSVYIGSSNAPATLASGKQATLGIDNVRIYDRVKTYYDHRDSENDLAAVEVELELRQAGALVRVRGAAHMSAGRPVPITLPPRSPGKFPFAMQSQRNINTTGARNRSKVNGYVHADGAYAGDIEVTGGAVSQGIVEAFPTPIMPAYRAQADTFVNGDFTFNGNSYSGVYYITGTAYIGSSVTINGSIIAERGVYRTSATNTNLTIIANRPGYPAILSTGTGGGFSDSVDLSSLNTVTISGLVYGSSGVNLDNTHNLTLRGAVLSGGSTRDLIFTNAKNSTVIYALGTEPPYFLN